MTPDLAVEQGQPLKSLPHPKKAEINIRFLILFLDLGCHDPRINISKFESRCSLNPVQILSQLALNGGKHHKTCKNVNNYFF